MFQVGDKIVHPMHGAGVIDGIVKRKLDGTVQDYYTVTLPNKKMLVMIPLDHCEEIGVRALLTPEETAVVLEEITRLEVSVEPNWNQRYRENMLRLKSGNLVEVAKVIKGLLLREGKRGLSTGERKMLHTARQILISEISLSQEIAYESAEKKVDAALCGVLLTEV